MSVAARLTETQREWIKRLYTERKSPEVIAETVRVPVEAVRQTIQNNSAPRVVLPAGFRFVMPNRSRGGSYVRVYPKNGIFISPAATRRWNPKTLLVSVGVNVDGKQIVFVPTERGRFKLTPGENGLRSSSQQIFEAFESVGAIGGRFAAVVRHDRLYIDCGERVG